MADFLEFVQDHQSHSGTAESLVIGFLMQTIQQQQSQIAELAREVHEAEADRAALIDSIPEAYSILHDDDRTADQRMWAILSLVDALYESFVGPLPLPAVESGLTTPTE